MRFNVGIGCGRDSLGVAVSDRIEVDKKKKIERELETRVLPFITASSPSSPPIYT